MDGGHKSMVLELCREENKEMIKALIVKFTVSFSSQIKCHIFDAGIRKKKNGILYRLLKKYATKVTSWNAAGNCTFTVTIQLCDILIKAYIMAVISSLIMCKDCSRNLTSNMFYILFSSGTCTPAC